MHSYACILLMNLFVLFFCQEFSNKDMSLLSFALSQSNYKEKLKLLLDLEQVAHEDELMSRYVDAMMSQS